MKLQSKLEKNISEKQLHTMDTTEFARYKRMKEAQRRNKKKFDHSNHKFILSKEDLKFMNKKNGNIITGEEAMNLDLNDIIVLHRIIALNDIGKRVRKGELGGYVQSEKNLGWLGLSWVYNDAVVYSHAKVHGNATVKDNSIIGGSASVYGSSCISGNSIIRGSAKIMGRATIKDSSVRGKSELFGEIILSDSNITDTCLYGNLRLNSVCLTGGEYYIHDEIINEKFKK